MVALKLVAIFRIVRAMDISRKQKLQDVTVRLRDDRLVIQYDSTENTALESWMFEKKKICSETYSAWMRNWCGGKNEF